MALSVIACAGLSGCTFMGADGQHSAWDAFKTRCVDQIASGRAVNTEGLRELTVDSIPQGQRADADPTDEIWGSENTLWTIQHGQDDRRCTLRGTSRGIEAHQRAMVWAKSQAENGAYQPGHDGFERGRMTFPDGRTARIEIRKWKHSDFMWNAAFHIEEE